MKEIDGFVGFITLLDEENRRTRNVLLWETRETAEEAERRFGPKREEIVREMGGTSGRRISTKRRSSKCSPERASRDGAGPRPGPESFSEVF